MLWRGHVNQGRYQPGRRAVLKEFRVRLTSKIVHEKAGFLKVNIEDKSTLS
jgi:hypothetical protein